jgi:DNA-binding MarR family transcriptional regulator
MMIMEFRDLFLQFIERYPHILIEPDGTGRGKSGFDITINQYFYLRGVQKNENTTLTELAAAVGVSKPSATAAVTKLIQDGYIVRTRSRTDQRRYHLTLGEKGREVFVQRQQAYRTFIRHVEKHTTAEEREILGRAFRIMARFPPEPAPGN